MSITAALPSGYAVTVGLANQLAVPYNGARQSLMFTNNSATAIISVCPATQYTIPSGTAPAVAGYNIPVAGVVSGPAMGVPGTNIAGSVTLLPGQNFIIDTFVCTCAWNAISSIAGGALTVLES